MQRYSLGFDYRKCVFLLIVLCWIINPVDLDNIQRRDVVSLVVTKLSPIAVSLLQADDVITLNTKRTYVSALIPSATSLQATHPFGDNVCSPGAWTIYGQVRDAETGEPAATTVFVYDADDYCGTFCGHWYSPTQWVGSDGSLWYLHRSGGQHHLKMYVADSYHVQTVYDERGNAYWTAAEAPTINIEHGTSCRQIDLKIYKYGTIWGEIRDTMGSIPTQTVSGAKITRVLNEYPALGPWPASVQTNFVTGIYTATGLHPALSYHLSIDLRASPSGSYSWYYNGTANADNATPIRVPTGGKKRVDFVVPQRNAANHIIAGRITDSNGDPLANVGVTLSNGAALSTDNAGFYTFSYVPVGTYTVQPLSARFSFQPSSRSVTVPPSATNVNFTATSIQTISGQIVNVDNNATPVAGVVVRANSGDETTTDVSGYYTFTNLADGTMLTPELAGYFFVPMTHTVTSNSAPLDFAANDRRPLIFIPGSAASYLVDQADNDELWPATFDPGKGRLSLFPNDNPANTIVATDAIRRDTGSDVYGTLLEYLTANLGYREYQVAALPARCDYAGQRHQYPKLFVFAYDWRKDNGDNATLLRDYMRCVQQFYPHAPVNLLTHSMGSLLARRYILAHPNDHGVAALTTMGAPWLGAPKAINVLETGDMGFPPVVVWDSTLQRIAGSFRGAHQLLPGEAYYTLAGAFFGEDGWDLDGDGNDQEMYMYADYIQLMNQRYGRAGFTPGTTGHDFHAYSAALGAQDDWRTDNTTVHYYHLHGQQARDKTIGQILAKSKISVIRGGEIVRETYFDLAYTTGDGTVPLLSADRKNGNINYNAPGAALTIVQGDFDHTTLTGNATVLNLVETILAAERPAAGAKVQADLRQTLRHNADTRLAASQPAGYLTIFGIPSFTLTDAHGNVVTVDQNGVSSVTNGTTQPSWVMHVLGNSIFRIITPANTPYTIAFAATDQPISVDYTLGDSVQTTKLVRYLDTALPNTTRTEIRLFTSNEPTLYHDTNRDNVVDTIIQPTVITTSSLASDQTAPQVMVTSSIQDNRALVTISATDSGSGVQMVWYSTDGVNYQAYATPFQVDLSQIRAITTFADDRVGNRSDVVTYAFLTSVLLPLVRGWNLLALPVLPVEQIPSAVLVNITGKYDLAYAYNGCVTSNPWQKYNPSGPPFANTLTAVNGTQGLWLRATTTATLSVTGVDLANTSIPLCVGWNLISYPSNRATPIATALGSIAGKYDLVYAYDASTPANPWKKYNPTGPPFANTLTELKPGAGYWLRVTQATTLVVE